MFARKNIHNSFRYRLNLTVSQSDEGYLATCDDWADCYAQGDTIEETLSEASLVAASLIELYQEEGKDIPIPLVEEINNPKEIEVQIPVIVSHNA